MDQRDIQHWKNKGVYETYIACFRTDLAKEKDAPDLKPFNLINNLKEPISRFGISLKNLALRYAQNNKKLFIIPMQTFSHGLAQKTQSNNKYVKKSVATDEFKASLLWRAWKLDGDNLNEFQSKYAKVLRALIEGRFSLYFVAVDKDTGVFEHVGVLNILQGALSLDQVYFSSKTGYRTFENIEYFDTQFYVDFNVAMNLFKLHPLAFVPRTNKDISVLYNFLF